MLALLAPAALPAQQPAFTIEQVMSAPFPDELVAAPAGGAVAWVFNDRGARNIWVAAPPDYRAHAITAYPDDDGQEITQLRWTPDTRGIVYVRGGGKNGRGEHPNPKSVASGVTQEIWLVAVGRGSPRRLGEGNAPAVAPKGAPAAFAHRRQAGSASIAPTTAAAH